MNPLNCRVFFEPVLETGREVELQAETVRNQVRERASAYFSTLDEALRTPHVRLIRARLSEPIALVLTSFLTGRQHQ